MVLTIMPLFEKWEGVETEKVRRPANVFIYKLSGVRAQKISIVFSLIFIALYLTNLIF